MTASFQPTVTAAIIALDEEAFIGDCIRRLAWADERLVVVDSRTTDRTREVALSFDARVLENEFRDFASQREFALSAASGDWVLFVDADEHVRDALACEVREAVANGEAVAGYWIPRENVILGRVIRGGGWYPDHQLRLLRRGAVHYDAARLVHELPVLEGAEGHLLSPFVHLNYRSIGDLFRKQRHYLPLEARQWRAKFGRPRVRALIAHPIREFWRRFVALRGYQDGAHGLLLALVMAWYAGRAVWLARTHHEV